MPATATDAAWLALGSNVGNRGQALRRMREELQRRGLVIEAASSEILTRPVGGRHQPDYHNQVLRVRAASALEPLAWLALVKDVERAAGRRPTYRWGPRVADVDILLLGARGEISVRDADLTVPHAELRSRPFLARLLADLDVRVTPAASAPPGGGP